MVGRLPGEGLADGMMMVWLPRTTMLGLTWRSGQVENDLDKSEGLLDMCACYLVQIVVLIRGTRLLHSDPLQVRLSFPTWRTFIVQAEDLPRA